MTRRQQHALANPLPSLVHFADASLQKPHQTSYGLFRSVLGILGGEWHVRVTLFRGDDRAVRAKEWSAMEIKMARQIAAKELRKVGTGKSLIGNRGAAWVWRRRLSKGEINLIRARSAEQVETVPVF